MREEVLGLKEIPFLAPVSHSSPKTVLVRRIVVMH